MAKAKVTKKWLNESYQCISVAYSGLDRLLTFESADYYTCGLYGWNYDGYRLVSKGRVLCLTTGYRGLITNCDNNNSHELYRAYDSKADKILSNHDIPCQEQRSKLSDLLDEYLDIVLSI